MKPYYDEDGITIYCGDCMDVLPFLTFDVIVTDPPYGINLDTDYSGLNGSTRTYERVAGDDRPFDPRPLLAWPALFFGANHFASSLPEGGTWHVWDKREGASSNMLADFETWWTSWASGPSRLFRFQWVCGVHPGSPLDRVAHPTVKPVPLMEHVLSSAPVGVVCDPYMGSGSTLIAARRLGRRAIGIELSEAYCEIAAKRLAQGVLDFGGAA